MKTSIITFLGVLFVLLMFHTNHSFCQENTPEEQYDGAKDKEQLPSSPEKQLEGLSPNPNPQVPEVPPPPPVEVVPSTSTTTTTTQDDNQKPEEKPSSNDNSGSKETQANPNP